MIVLVIVVVCVLFALVTCFILYQLDVLPGRPGSGGGTTTWGSTLGARTPLREASRPDREWPHGCLIALLVGAGIWFLLWGVVLILALRVLSNPFS